MGRSDQCDDTMSEQDRAVAGVQLTEIPQKQSMKNRPRSS